MKKTFKRITALALTVVLCFSLCSCIDIKALKESHAYYTDQTETSIIFGGKTYDLIKEWPEDVEVFLPKTGMVGDKEQPVLVSSFAGDEMAYNEAKEIISVYASGYFCLTEKYDEIVASLDNIQLDKYCLRKYVSDGFFSEFKEEIILLEGELLAAVEETLKTVKPTDEYIELWDYVSVYKCDSTKTFIESDISIFRTENGKYYIEKSSYNEKKDSYETLSYRIPAQKEHLFEELMDNMLEYR